MAVVEALGKWGIRWIGELVEQDLDPDLLMSDMQPHDSHRSVAALGTTWPSASTARRRRRLVVAMVSDGAVPTYATSIPATKSQAPFRPAFVRLLGSGAETPKPSPALLDGSVSVSGPVDVRRAVPTWIGQSDAAAIAVQGAASTGSARSR